MNVNLIETIKCFNGEIYNLSFHEDRIFSSINKKINLNQYISFSGSDLTRCRVLYNKNGILNVSYFKYTIKSIKSFALVYDDDIVYDKKYEDRDNINRLYELKKDSNEIIIIKNNLITDTSIANIACYYNDLWITPRIPLLYGTTLKRFIKDGSLECSDITLGILKSSTKIATLNAMVGFNIIDDFEIVDTLL